MTIKKKPIKEETREPVPERSPEQEPVKEARAKTTPARPAYLVYIGPSIRGHLVKNAVIRRDQFKALERSLEAYPEIKHLLVTGDQVAASRAMVRQPDSYLHAVYAQLAGKA